MNWKIMVLSLALVQGPYAHAASVSPAAAHSWKVKRNSQTIYSGHVGPHRLRISVRTFALEGTLRPGAPGHFAQCTTAPRWCDLTAEINVTLDGRPLFLPRNAYADLGDLTEMSARFAGDDLILTARGGDAAESYIAKLQFDSRRLVVRRLYSGEDPYHPVEVSQYLIVRG